MLQLLRRLYRRLPVVREFRACLAASQRLARDQRRLLNLRASEYEERLLAGPRYADPKALGRYERQVFSQCGEDGIIAEIFRRIGTGSRRFLEIGVGDGLQNNTAFLLMQGWSGHWIDADSEGIRSCLGTFRQQLQEGRLHVRQAFLTAENVGEVVDSLGVEDDLDLFSLDVDQNTFWIWKALQKLRPRVAVVEYNPHIPPDVDWKVAYEAEATWDGTSHFGASLKALENLAGERGLRLVGCTLAGFNAFFVREDLCADRFEEPFNSEHHYEPFRPFLVRRAGHRAGWGEAG